MKQLTYNEDFILNVTYFKNELEPLSNALRDGGFDFSVKDHPGAGTVNTDHLCCFSIEANFRNAGKLHEILNGKY